MDLKVSKKGDFLILKRENVVLAKISSRLLDLFDSGGLTPPTPKKKKKKKLSEETLQVMAMQFSKAYDRAKKAHFKTARTVKSVDPKSKAFKHFVGAVEICKVHKVTYKKYIEAQRTGLANMVAFPLPAHMDTEAAETRLLNYLQLHSSPDTLSQVRETVEFGEFDKEQSLKDNIRYKKYRKFISEGMASLEQAEYCAKCEKYKLGKAKKTTRKYLSGFN